MHASFYIENERNYKAFKRDLILIYFQTKPPSLFHVYHRLFFSMMWSYLKPTCPNKQPVSYKADEHNHHHIYSQLDYIKFIISFVRKNKKIRYKEHMNNVQERIAQHVFDAFKLLEYIYTRTWENYITSMWYKLCFEASY